MSSRRCRTSLDWFNCAEKPNCICKQIDQMQNIWFSWDNSVTMRRVGVLIIGGGSDLWQPELHPSVIYTPVDVVWYSYVSWNYLRNEFLLCVFSCERYSTRPRDFFRTKISFWCFDGVKQKLHALFLDAKALILCFGKLFPHVTLLLIF